MYGIHLSRAGESQNVQLGLRKRLPFANLHDVYRLVLPDLAHSELKVNYVSNPEWGSLTLGNGADLELMLRVHEDVCSLEVRDLENGNYKRIVVHSLEEVFEFIADWAQESLRAVGEWDE